MEFPRKKVAQNTKHKTLLPKTSFYEVTDFLKSARKLPASHKMGVISTITDGVIRVLSILDKRMCLKNIDKDKVMKVQLTDESRQTQMSKIYADYRFKYQGYCFSKTLLNAIEARYIASPL